MADRDQFRAPISRWWVWLVPALLWLTVDSRVSAAPFFPIDRVKVRIGDDTRWAQPDYDDSGWPEIWWHEVDSQKRLIWLRGEVDLGSGAHVALTPAVHISALAAYEIYWNDTLIGRSGKPAPSASAERPGQIDGHFRIPPELIRPGRNIVAIRMSSFHLPIRVQDPLQRLVVDDYEVGVTAAFRTYAAAIVAAGALLISGLFFAATYMVDRSQRGALLLTLLSLTLLSHLFIESLRGFVSYNYDLHLWRVGAMFVLAGLFGILLVAYIRLQFWVSGGHWPIWLAAAWCGASFFLFDGFDPKIAGAVMGSTALAAAMLVPSALRGHRAAILALCGCGAMVAAFVFSRADFLNRDFFLLATAVLAVLFVHRARVQPVDSITAPPAATTSGHFRLPVITAKGLELLDLTSVVTIHGADDYAEARILCGARRLYRGRLGDLERELPPNFMRVHRSHIVNTDHVQRLLSTQGMLKLQLDGGVTVPVSRSHASKVRRWFVGSANALAAGTTAQ